TVLGFQMGYLLGGTVVIEEIFALPGMGRLVLQAIFQRDYPVVQGVVLVIAFLFVLTNRIVDVLYAWIDPRTRSGYSRPNCIGRSALDRFHALQEGYLGGIKS